MPPSAQAGPTIAVFANKGDDSNEADRIRTLLSALEPQAWSFDRTAKVATAAGLIRRIANERPDLVVMEGTGIAGGLAVLGGRALWGVPYVVSTGDAVGPFLSLHGRGFGALGHVYERVLYASSAGVIGWTPYLVGRALALGAPRAATAEGWAPFEAAPGDRDRVRDRLGLRPDQIVVGLVGALNWSRRRRYCYGLELVRAVRRVARDDVVVVVVGDGDGRARLRREAGDDLGRRVLLPGRVDQADVPGYLAAFDVGSLPQSVDKVGSYRYTTKISEYLNAGLPIVTGRLPFAYDLDDGWLWRLPGHAPWSGTYVAALAAWLEEIDAGEISRRRDAVPGAPIAFDRVRQMRRVEAFVGELLADQRR